MPALWQFRTPYGCKTVLLRERFISLEVSMKLKIFVVLTMCLACAGTASAGSWPANLLGFQIRKASPWMYQAYLGTIRSIPPQVRNQMPIFGAYPGIGIYSPWQQELAYWRRMPPQVRNNIIAQQQLGYPAVRGIPQSRPHHPPVYIPAVRQPQIQATIIIGPGVTAPPPNSIMPYAGR